MSGDKITPTVMLTILMLGGALPVFRWNWYRKLALWRVRNTSQFSAWLNPWSSPEAIDSPFFRLFVTAIGLFFIGFGLFGLWGVWSG